MTTMPIRTLGDPVLRERTRVPERFDAALARPRPGLLGSLAIGDAGVRHLARLLLEAGHETVANALRVVQGIFDDRNPATTANWRYPDTNTWDPARNTREFLAAMPEWKKHGLAAFTINSWNWKYGAPLELLLDQPSRALIAEVAKNCVDDLGSKLEAIDETYDDFRVGSIVDIVVQATS